MSQSDDYILLGEVSGIHGIKGWVKVFSHTSPRVKITEYSHWFLRGKNQAWKETKLLGGKQQGKNIIALLEGVKYRDQAEALIGQQIAIHSDQLETLAEDEYFWKDLIGLSVETIEGQRLGIVDWMFNTGSNDVIIVKNDTDVGNKEHMLPFLFDDVIQTVDLEKRLIVADWDPEF